MKRIVSLLLCFLMLFAAPAQSLALASESELDAPTEQPPAPDPEIAPDAPVADPASEGDLDAPVPPTEQTAPSEKVGELNYAPLPPAEERLATDGVWRYSVSNGEATITDYIYYYGSGGKVTIPASLGGYPVTTIGYRAFYDCWGLTSVTIGNSVTSIGDEAFAYCTGLTSVTIPDSVASIGGSAFYRCTALMSITIPDSVTSIGDYVFYGCTYLASVIIPDSVTSIGYGAFEDCTNLKYNSFDNGLYLGNTANPYLVLMNASSNSITSCAIHSDTRFIYGSAFSGCSDLTSVTIPDSVTSIGSSAFYRCSGLTSVTIPDSVTTISEYAFSGCSGLTSIAVAKMNPVYHSAGNCLIETASKTLIAGCKSSAIPSDGSVTSIGYGAFEYCSGLTSVTIPDSVTSIGSSAFDGCSGLTSVTIPNSVTSIGSWAFCYCTGLTSVTIGNGVKTIGSYAFRDCSGLTSVSIPDGVTSIGDSAFYFCSGLTSVTIGNGVTSIGSEAFSGCSNLQSITLPFVGYSRKKASDKDQYPFGYIFGTHSYTGSTKVTQHYYGSSTTSATSTTYYIPASLKTVVLTDCAYIPYGAFYGCTMLTSVTIPDSVTSIGDYAFYNCSGLTSVTIPDSVTTIGNYAFEGCSIQKLIIAEGSKKVTSTMVVSKSTLQEVIIPDSVTSIGNSAFSGCANLKYNSFDNGLYLGNTATPYLVLMKASSSSITSCAIHPDARFIYGSAFSGCTYLASITIPDSVTSIGDSAFDGCTGLKTVYYGGCSGEEWNAISLGASNTYLQNAARVYHATHCSDVVYTWSGDLSACTAARTCSRCGATEEETAAAVAVTEPENTCVNDWATVYTASFKSAAYEAQTVTVEGKALNHAWGEPTYTFSADGKTCTAQRLCLHNTAHKETETVNTVTSVTKKATCEEPGETTFVAFKFNNPAFQGGQVLVLSNLPATGHRWGTVAYTWALDEDGDMACTATRVCKNDPSHVETETVKAFGVPAKTPTCTEAGEISYFVSFTNAAFKDQSKANVEVPPCHTGEVSYLWSDDLTTCTAVLTCTVCGKEIRETAEAEIAVTKAASCTAPEITTISASFLEPTFKSQKKERETAPALTHTWGAVTYTWSKDNTTCTATRICANDPTHVETETVNASVQVKQALSCADPEIATFTATFTNKAFAAQVKDVETKTAAGHAWGEVAYTWSADFATCTATRTCANDPAHKETETVNAAATVKTPATCLTSGVTTFTAAFTNPAFAAKITRTENATPAALGHAWGEVTYVWSDDNATCTATRTCANDPTHVETETATASVQVKQALSCTKSGITAYTATFENKAFAAQTKTVTVPATGHRNTVLRNAVEATATANGYTGDLYCTDCNALVKKGEVIPMTGPCVSVESKTVNSGKTFTLTVSIANNPGIMSMLLTPVIPDGLTLVKVEGGAILPDLTTGINILLTADEDVTENGVLLTLTLTVAEGAEFKDYEVGFLLLEAVNQAEEDVAFTVLPGTVTVVDFLWGDANGDGVVSSKDIVRLKNYFANYNDSTGLSTVEIFPGADANGDGVVSSKDIVRLKNYFANYNDETGLSTVILGPAA